MPTSSPQAVFPLKRQRRFYSSIWVQVTLAIALAVVFGYVRPAYAVAMKPLGATPSSV